MTNIGTGRQRVAIAGYFGMRNFGDDLFVSLARLHHEALWQNSVVRTFTPQESGLHSKFGHIGSMDRAIRAAVSTLWADRVVLFGGSVLSEVRGTTRLRAAHARKLEALGVSIGPFRNSQDEREVAQLMSALERLVVRDRSSEAMSPNAVYGGDIAGLIPETLLAAPGSCTRDDLVVAPSSDSHDTENFGRRVLNTLRNTPLAERPQVSVVALNCHPTVGDVEEAERLGASLRSSGCTVRVLRYDELGLTGTLSLLAGACAVWSQRLHGAIVAYLADVPFVIAGHHSKCIDFARDVELASALIVDGNGDGLEESGPISLHAHSPWKLSVDAYRKRAHEVYLGDDLEYRK